MNTGGLWGDKNSAAVVPEYGGDDIQGGGTKFRGVVLVEFLWKAISGIINRWLSSSIRYHGIMYGFRAGR